MDKILEKLKAWCVFIFFYSWSDLSDFIKSQKIVINTNKM